MTPLEISLLIIAVFFIWYSSYLLWRIRENGYKLEKLKESLQDEYDKLSEEYTELSNKHESLVGTNAANARYKDQYKKERDEAIQELEEYKEDNKRLRTMVGSYKKSNNKKNLKPKTQTHEKK